MRKALNENPVVQIAVIGVLFAAAALFLLMRGGGGSAPSSASPAAAGGRLAGVQPVATPTVGTPTVATPTVGFEPGPGLPRAVLASYQSNDVVVLLVVRRGGIDDELVRQSTRALKSMGGISVFVVRSRDIAKYAGITQGLAIDRTPALIVMRPERLSSGVPQAEVRYGFQSGESVLQAVRDALYNGPERSYDP